MGLKTIADYINWKNEGTIKPEKPDFSKEWRPPVLPVMYDKPQTTLVSPLDTDPIIKRVLYNPKLPGPRALPVLGTPGFQFFAGLVTGFFVTMIFTCKDLGRKEVQDLVLYDPAYFPEFAAMRGNKA